MLAILEDNIDVLKLNADIVEVLKKKKNNSSKTISKSK